MKFLKVALLVLVSMTISLGSFARNNEKKTKTAEEVYATIATLDQYDEEFIKAEIKSLPTPERVKLAKMSVKETRRAIEAGEEASVGYYILAIFIPPLAVGLNNGVGKEFWIDLVLTILCWLPGIIYAFIVL